MENREEDIQVFNLKGNKVKTIVGQDGEAWFVAKDVAEGEYLNTQKAIQIVLSTRNR